MGEAKNIVKGISNGEGHDEESILGKLDDILDDIDSVIQIKIQDLFYESEQEKPKNHFKLGLLKGADGLIRRARAMLEDYCDGLKDDNLDDLEYTAESELTYDD